jgi:hypothetical protein
MVRYLQRLTASFALVLEDELAVALEVALGVHDPDVADVYHVDYACVRQRHGEAEEVDAGEKNYVLDRHVDSVFRVGEI